MNLKSPIKAMLAYDAAKKPINYANGIYIQAKLDGCRCLIQLDDNQEVVAYSRNHKEWMNIEHIKQELAPFFKQNPTTILDGELYNHALKENFNKIISLVRKQKPTADDRWEAKALVQFHVYDYIDHSADDYSTRSKNLNCASFYSDYVKHVGNDKVHSFDEAKEFHAFFLLHGYEGSIIRLNGSYEQKRSYNLCKFKDFHDTEATITDFVVGKGKRTGTIGKFIGVDSEGQVIGIPVMGKQVELLANFEEMKTWIGEICTFTYFQRTPAGSYRHPLFKCIRNYE